ncbi:MAG: MarR family transcriptional regulator [Roseiflexaceae bacterium]|nr:MarR family transcriptional regulator [Roseiflexaceae bacterium]
MEPTSACSELLLLVKRVHLAVRRAYDTAFAAHGITGPQAQALRAIWQHHAIEQRTLHEQLGVTSPTLTGIVDGLVERNLVMRQVSADDARVKQLVLTAHGRAVSEALAALMPRMEAQIIAGFSATEQALLCDWLGRVACNLDAVVEHMPH